MDFYALTLTGLMLANAGLLYRPHWRGKSGDATLKNFNHALRIIVRLLGISRGKSPLSLEYAFLPVYVLVIASDWLQVRCNVSSYGMWFWSG